MRLRMNERRERRFENLMEATGEGTKSGALDVAADYYIRMAGGNSAVPTGRIEELVRLAREEGNLTAEEIVDVLDSDEYPVSVSSEFSFGRD